MNERTGMILNWLTLQLNNAQEDITLTAITNDASQRKYYRCYEGKNTYIVMDSNLDPSFPIFIKIAKQFRQWGLSVPEIYNYDLAHGLILMSDLGNDLYLDKLNDNTAEELYSAALEALLLIQKQTVTNDLLLPNMRENYICHQLGVFQQWFLQRHLQLTITSEIQLLLVELGQLFTQIFISQPQVLVHLDYHSRNLMLLPGNKTGILDFQDAMIGPITYDLVSLLQDAYILWPRLRIENWVSKYQELAKTNKILQNIAQQDFIRWFDLVGLQRHLKNLGVFARLHHRDAKSKYLNDMPMLMRYILETGERYPELHKLQLFFTETVAPKLKEPMVM